MPIKGIERLDATLELIPRLFATTGNVGNVDFDLVIISDEDTKLHNAVVHLVKRDESLSKKVQIVQNDSRQGYWKCLAMGARHTDAPLLINLANDLIPGREWLLRGLKTHRAASEHLQRDAVVGFNDGVHPGNHAGHLMIPRSILERWYGNDLFPIMYDHLHADVEMVVRAMEEGRFVYSTFAVLFHNHHVNGKPFDPVYKLGHAKEQEDYRLYQKRRANGWT